MKCARACATTDWGCGEGCGEGCLFLGWRTGCGKELRRDRRGGEEREERGRLAQHGVEGLIEGKGVCVWCDGHEGAERAIGRGLAVAADEEVGAARAR